MAGPLDVFFFTDARGYGGAEKSLLTLMDGLDARRWRATLVHHDSPGAAGLISAARELGAGLWAVPRMDEGLSGALRIPAFAAAVARRRPAVFHAHLTWPIACKFGLAGAILARVPAIVATQHAFLEIPMTRPRYAQQQLIARGVGRYIAVSHYVRDRLLATFGWTPDKVVVIPNGIDLAAPAGGAPGLRAQLSREGARSVALALARLDPWRGLHHLLRAAVRLPDVQVVIAGEGDQRSELERLAGELGIEDRVDFLGHRDDVWQLLAASDVMVQPSLTEGFSLSLLEAMAAGKPIVATAVGGTVEMLEDHRTALLVAPGDPSALAEAIRELLDDPEAASALARRARGHVERFSSQAMLASTTQVYDELLRPAAGEPERRTQS